MSLNRAVVTAANILMESIAAEYPETDTRLLARRLQELVQNTVSSSSSQYVVITASDVTPKVNHAADALALAHCMWMEGDKVNSGKLVQFAFNHHDCFPLMETLSNLNEEADPISASDMEIQINRVDEGKSDVTGDPNTVIENAPLIVNPVLDPVGDVSQDTPITDTDGSPEAILAELELQPQHLGDESFDGGGFDAVPGFDDNFLSNIDSDPSTDTELNPQNWDLDHTDDTGMEDSDLLMNFEPDESSEMFGSPGISDTAEGMPKTGTEFNNTDNYLGENPMLDPMQAVIAKVKDPKAKAVINVLANDKSNKGKANLKAFLNLYMLRNKL